jgi:hypothetical protein
MTLLPSAAQMPLFTSCQRWSGRRECYRPAGEPIDVSRYEVRPVSFAEAKRFVLTSHYSGTMPASRMAVGLYSKPTQFQAEHLAGVIVFSVPVQEAAIPAWLEGLPARQGVEIGRLVLADAVPANGETFMLGRAFRLLRDHLPEIAGVLSYCDPVERRDESGAVVKRGHVGTVYKAHNGRFVGRSSPRTLVLARDGRCVSERALSKVRGAEQGADYAERQLVEMGAPARRPHESGADYVRRALAEGGFRRARHPGNFVFTWRFDRRAPACTRAHQQSNEQDNGA